MFLLICEYEKRRYNSNQPAISEISEKATGGTCVEGQRVNVCVDNYIKHESFAYIYNLSLYEVVLLDRYGGKEKRKSLLCIVFYFDSSGTSDILFARYECDNKYSADFSDYSVL